MSVIGVPLRYTHMSDDRPILYLGEKVRRTLQKAGAIVFPICPVQDVDYIDTKGNMFPELTEEGKRVISQNLDMCDGVFFPGGGKFTESLHHMIDIYWNLPLKKRFLYLVFV